jgi:hypothetical protein
MIELVKTDDRLRLHFLKSMLEDAGLHPIVVEASSYPGVLPMRLIVPDDEGPIARRVIAEAEREL